MRFDFVEVREEGIDSSFVSRLGLREAAFARRALECSYQSMP
jgi:hypothetical protein